LQCYGDDVFEVFRKLLLQPDDFMSRSTEAVFGTVLSEVDEEDRPWADYLIDRYTLWPSLTLALRQIELG